MRRVRIAEPQVNCQVIGCLYESDVRYELGSDMLEVILENGILIDAGWYPEGNPQGSYVISVTRGRDELVEARTTKDASQAARIVEELIETLGGDPVRLAESRRGQ